MQQFQNKRRRTVRSRRRDDVHAVRFHVQIIYPLVVKRRRRGVIHRPASSFTNTVNLVLVLFPDDDTTITTVFVSVPFIRSPKLDQTKENLSLIFWHIFSILALDNHVSSRRDDEYRRDGVLVVVRFSRTRRRSRRQCRHFLKRRREKRVRCPPNQSSLRQN